MKYTDFAIRGIDVSQFNGLIDWSKVKADFTVIRVGHGRVIDPKFKANWAGAKGKTFRLPYWYLDYYSHCDPTTSAYGLYSDAEWGRIQAEKNWNALASSLDGMKLIACANGGRLYTYTETAGGSQVIWWMMAWAKELLRRLYELLAGTWIDSRRGSRVTA